LAPEADAISLVRRPVAELRRGDLAFVRVCAGARACAGVCVWLGPVAQMGPNI
jgi:hypothetical protein